MDHFSMMEATWLFSVLRILKPVMFTPLYRYGSTSSANRSCERREFVSNFQTRTGAGSTHENFLLS